MAERWIRPAEVVRGMAHPDGVEIEARGLVATATREPDGSISTSVEPVAVPNNGGSRAPRVFGWPLIRGMVDLSQWGSGPPMQILVFAMVVACPLMFVIAESLPRVNGWLVAAGAVAYPFWTVTTALRMAPPLKEIPAYHAAEHQVIFCLDSLGAGESLTVDAAARMSPIDPRCGSGDTAWWVMGMWLVLPLVDLVWPSGWVAAAVEPVAVIFLGAAVGSEVNRVVHEHHSAWWVRPLTWPAWLVQRVWTMGRATPEHLEVAVAAVNALVVAAPPEKGPTK